MHVIHHPSCFFNQYIWNITSIIFETVRYHYSFIFFRYGKVFKTHILGRPIIVSTDPDVNRTVLQNHGNVFIPCYPKSVTELLGKSSILQMNGNVQKRLHGLIGGFLRSPQLKSRIARDIENSVKFSLSNWNCKKQLIYLQDETKRVSLSLSLTSHIYILLNFNFSCKFIMLC